MVYEDWMFNVAVAVAGVVGTYAVLRNRVDRLEKDLQSHCEKDRTIQQDLEHKQSIQFKRIDTSLNRITVLERDTQSHLTMPIAVDTFVSKSELELHLKNIDIKQNNMDKKLDKMENNVEKILEIIRSTKNEK